jgi:hypothetical protein
MAGPLKTLFGALQASTFLTANNVTLVFGPEEINKTRYARPYVVMVPTSAPYDNAPGYAANTDPYTEMLWEKALTVEFWCFNSATGVNQGAIDHTDAIETLEGWMLSALQDQRAQYTDVNNVAYGLQYKIASGRWEVFGDNAAGPLSRAWVISGQIKITTSMTQPQEATILNVTTNEVI